MKRGVRGLRPESYKLKPVWHLVVVMRKGAFLHVVEKKGLCIGSQDTSVDFPRLASHSTRIQLSSLNGLPIKDRHVGNFCYKRLPLSKETDKVI